MIDDSVARHAWLPWASDSSRILEAHSRAWRGLRESSAGTCRQISDKSNTSEVSAAHPWSTATGSTEAPSLASGAIKSEALFVEALASPLPASNLPANQGHCRAVAHAHQARREDMTSRSSGSCGPFSLPAAGQQTDFQGAILEPQSIF